MCCEENVFRPFFLCFCRIVLATFSRRPPTYADVQNQRIVFSLPEMSDFSSYREIKWHRAVIETLQWPFFPVIAWTVPSPYVFSLSIKQAIIGPLISDGLSGRQISSPVCGHIAASLLLQRRCTQIYNRPSSKSSPVKSSPPPPCRGTPDTLHPQRSHVLPAALTSGTFAQ